MKKETREKSQEGDIRKIREIVNVVKRGRDGKKGRGEMDRELVRVQMLVRLPSVH